ncbi:MAG: DM13 domain-containing protein [Cyanobacteria bacterium P01_G01_bin.67]
MKQVILFLSALTLALSPGLAKADNVMSGAEILKSASFAGENGHEVSGGVQIVKQGEIQYLVLQEDFQFDGAPDPKLGFSQNGEFVEDSLFSGLNLDQGQQIYRLPVDFDAADYDEVTVWCDKFDVSLAEAKY